MHSLRRSKDKGFLAGNLILGLAFIIQVENESGSVSWSTFDAFSETITRQGLFCRQFDFGPCDLDFVSSQDVQALQGRSHRCFSSSDTANWF